MEHICTNCEHCVIDEFGHEYWVEYDFRCKKDIVSINHVTGDVTYGNCYSRNSNGQCNEFEPKMSSWEKFKASLKIRK